MADDIPERKPPVNDQQDETDRWTSLALVHMKHRLGAPPKSPKRLGLRKSLALFNDSLPMKHVPISTNEGYGTSVKERLKLFNDARRRENISHDTEKQFSLCVRDKKIFRKLEIHPKPSVIQKPPSLDTVTLPVIVYLNKDGKECVIMETEEKKSENLQVAQSVL